MGVTIGLLKHASHMYHLSDGDVLQAKLCFVPDVTRACLRCSLG